MDNLRAALEANARFAASRRNLAYLRGDPRRRSRFARGEMTTRRSAISLRPAHDRRACGRHAVERCRTGPAGSAIGMSACRRPDRWTIATFASPTGIVGNPEDAAGAGTHADAGRRCASISIQSIALTGARDARDARWRPRRLWRRSTSRAGRCLTLGAHQGPRQRAPISRSATASTRRSISARARPSPRRSAATRPAPCAPAMCCALRETGAMRAAAGLPSAPADLTMTGRSACSTARTARRISSREEDIDDTVFDDL